MKPWLLLATFGALFVAIPVAMAQQARLSNDIVVPGDLVTLEVSYRNTRSSMFKLDTSPLEADFEVVDIKPSMKMDRQQGSYVNIMNWQVLLAPKRTGKITIPSLTIRETSTPQLELRVEAINPWRQFGEDVRLELSVDKTSPRIGEKFIITLHFFSNRPIITGFLRDPEISGAKRLGLGRDRLYPLTENGIEYQVLERSMAFFAESAGPLVINPAEYRGSLRAVPSIAGLSGSRQFRRFSEPLSVDIRPLPDGMKSAQWHPVETALLTQQWQIPQKPLQAGDQILRQITLKTTGLPPEAFDKQLFQGEVRGADSFFDQPQQSISIDNEKIEAEFRQDQLFIVTREGPIALPDIVFNYWDTGLDQAATASLAGRLLDVPPAAFQSAPQSTSTAQASYLWMVAVGLPGILLLVVWLMRRQLGANRSRRYGYQLNKLKSACQRNDALECARQMLAWGRTQQLLTHAAGLRSLALTITDERLRERLLELDAAIYGAATVAWEGKPLWSAFKQYRLPKSLVTLSQASLPPLYPEAVHRAAVARLSSNSQSFSSGD